MFEKAKVGPGSPQGRARGTKNWKIGFKIDPRRSEKRGIRVGLCGGGLVWAGGLLQNVIDTWPLLIILEDNALGKNLESF